MNKVSKKPLRSDRFSYISWSKMCAIEQGENVFVDRYIKGIHQESIYLDFGKLFAKSAEKNKSEDLIINAIVKSLPKGEPEKKLEHDWDGIKLLAILDRDDKSKQIVWEFKTGTKLWTEKDLRNCGQTKFYAFLHWLKFRINPLVGLISIETEKTDQGDFWEMRPTGRTKKMTIEYPQKEMLLMANRVKKDWEKIIHTLKKYE